MSALPQLLTTREVCTALRISRRTLYRRTYRYVQETPGEPRRYFADDIRLVLNLNVVTPVGKTGQKPTRTARRFGGRGA